jgi:hypothetical protein
VDHCASEWIGLHAAKPGTRFEAIEPVRQGIRALVGGYEPGIAAGLVARHDHGSQEELRLALLEFKERYNRQWLRERHGHQRPVQVRAQRLERAA